MRLNVLPDNPETSAPSSSCGIGRFPSWLHRRIEKGAPIAETDRIVQKHGLKTVCEEAFCPNIHDCWGKKSATFLVLGKECTRSCGFCAVSFSKTPPPPMNDEGEKVAASILELGLRHAVLTMPARDDLPDGGAMALKTIVHTLSEKLKGCTLELLTSDFLGNKASWEMIAALPIKIFNHNVETVRHLTPRVRHKATYERSLTFLQYIKRSSTFKPLIKSGFMVGLGETMDEIKETLLDLAKIGTDIVIIGQYLQSDPRKLRVKRFVLPQEFEEITFIGKSMGIPHVIAAPFMRSSYNASSILDSVR